MAESCWWVSNIKISILLKKRWFYCQSILEMRQISHLHGLALFAIPLNPVCCFQMFQHVTMSSSISSLQSMLCFQTSCMNIFGLSMTGEIIPKGSNMLLVKLSIPCFVFGTSLYNHFFKWYFIEVKIYWFWW